MKIVITGVQGFLGSELARRFMDQGHQVAGLSRRSAGQLDLSASYAVGLGDSAPAGAFRDADLLVHAAHDRSPGAEEKNISGTRRWAEQARREGVVTQLFLTSVSAHPDAPSEYGRAKAALEIYFESIGGLLLRPGLVVGKGGTFGDMANLLKRFPVVPILGGDRLQVVLTDVDALFTAVSGFQNLRPGACYNLFQPDWLGLLGLSHGIRRHFGLRNLLVPVPLALSVALLTLGQKSGLAPTLGPESLKNLERCREYAYVSSYPELGLPLKTLDEMLQISWPQRQIRA